MLKRALILGGALAIIVSTGSTPHAQACGANPIVCENSLPGNPASDWDISGSGDSSIQGFATDISVDQGQTVRFKISSTASAYRLDIYRLGSYGGLGARKVATVRPTIALPQSQPACLTNATTGLIDCGNWAESVSWNVPATAVSGIYIAKAVRESGTTGASHIAFVVNTKHRIHCLVWSNYATQPQLEAARGIRLDTNYYYWPMSWVADRPGFFTGSGIPMRFVDTAATILDIYQATTQMTDESGQTFPMTINSLLDKAIGPQGYYGAFTANMHTDYNPSAGKTGSDAIVASAMARGVPVITARQLLTWLDGRNGSSFQSLAWNGTALTFSVAVGSGANGLQTLVPTKVTAGTLTTITLNGSPVVFTTQTIKGVEYAIFTVAAGTYRATYTP